MNTPTYKEDDEIDNLPNISYKKYPKIELNQKDLEKLQKQGDTESLSEDEIDLKEIEVIFKRMSYCGPKELTRGRSKNITPINKDKSLQKMKRMSSALQIGNEIIENIKENDINEENQILNKKTRTKSKMSIVITDEKNENKTPRLLNEKTKSDVTRELSIENFKEWKKEEDENYFLILSD